MMLETCLGSASFKISKSWMLQSVVVKNLTSILKWLSKSGFILLKILPAGFILGFSFMSLKMSQN